MEYNGLKSVTNWPQKTITQQGLESLEGEGARKRTPHSLERKICQPDANTRSQYRRKRK